MGIYKTEHFGIARKIVSNMTSQSWEEIPHAAMSYEADVTEMMKYVKKLNENVTDKSKKITVNTVMMKIICEGLKAAPKMNATLDFNRKLVRGSLHYHDNIDVSMPMMLHTGEMMTVNMHEVMFEVSLDNTINGLKEGKVGQTVYRLYGSKMPGKHKVHTLSGDAKKEYYSISHKDRLTKHDIEQGTTTISNLGSIYRNQKGLCLLLEIIPPQTTAFAVNAIQKRPVVETNEKGEDQIVVKSILPLTIAIDHRSLDYNDCVPFFEKLDEIFADPSVILGWK